MSELISSTLAKASARLQDAHESAQRITKDTTGTEHPERLPSSGMEQLFKPLDYPDISNHLNPQFKKFGTGQINTQTLNPRVMEMWIDSTLCDAEFLEVPGLIVSKDSIKPLTRYGIDRASLMRMGVGHKEIDQIYRQLFVYTMGFYNMITSVVRENKYQFQLKASLWKVYAILLEYCCHIDYSMIITRIETANKDYAEELSQNYENEIYKLEKTIKKMNQEHCDLSASFTAAEAERTSEMHRRKQLEQELENKGSTFEVEIETRLKFEAKLNELYARQLENSTKIQNAKDSIKDMKEVIKRKNVDNEKLVKERNQWIEDIERLQTDLQLQEQRFRSALKRTNAKEMDLQIAQSETHNLKHKIHEISQKNLDTDRLQLDLKLQNDQILSKHETTELEVRNLQKKWEQVNAKRSRYEKRIGELDRRFSARFTVDTALEQEVAELKEQIVHMTDVEVRSKAKLAKYKEKLETMTQAKESVSYNKENMEGQVAAADQRYQFIKARFDDLTKVRKRLEEENFAQGMLNDKLNKDLDKMHEDKMEVQHNNEELQEKMKEMKTFQAFQEKQSKQMEDKFRMVKRDLEDKLARNIEKQSQEKSARMEWVENYEAETKRRRNAEDVKKVLETELAEAKVHIIGFENALIMRTQEIQKQRDIITELLQNSGESELHVNQHKNKVETLKAILADIQSGHKVIMDKIRKDTGEKLERAAAARVNLDMKYEDLRSRAYELLIYKSDLAIDNRRLGREDTRLRTLTIAAEGSRDTIKEYSEGLENKIEELNETVDDLNKKLEDMTELRDNLQGDYDDRTNEFYRTRDKLFKLTKTIPPDYKHCENPVTIMFQQLKKLQLTQVQKKESTGSQVDRSQFQGVQATQTNIGNEYFNETPAGDVKKPRGKRRLSIPIDEMENRSPRNSPRVSLKGDQLDNENHESLPTLERKGTITMSREAEAVGQQSKTLFKVVSKNKYTGPNKEQQLAKQIANLMTGATDRTNKSGGADRGSLSNNVTPMAKQKPWPPQLPNSGSAFDFVAYNFGDILAKEQKAPVIKQEPQQSIYYRYRRRGSEREGDKSRISSVPATAIGSERAKIPIDVGHQPVRLNTAERAVSHRQRHRKSMSQSMDNSGTKNIISNLALSPRSECYDTQTSLPIATVPSTTRNISKKDPKIYYDYQFPQHDYIEHGIKKHFKQANSRNKDDFKFI